MTRRLSLVLLDNHMPGLSGLEVAAQILAGVSDQAIALFSAFLDETSKAGAGELGWGAWRRTTSLDLPQIITAILLAR